MPGRIIFILALGAICFVYVAIQVYTAIWEWRNSR
jgi:hypothetical protein